MTRADLLDGNRDLLEHAGRALARGTVCGLDAEVMAVRQRTVELKVTTRAVADLDVYVDGRPSGTGRTATPDGTTTIQVPLPSPDAAVIRLQGHTDGALVAARQVSLQ